MKKIIMMLLAISLLQQTDLLAQTPSITCPANQTVPAAANSCNAVVNNIDPIISPAGASYSYLIVGTGESATGSVSGKTFPVGVTTIVYSLTNYPTITCSFTVTVADKTPPVLQCPTNLAVKCAQDIPLPTDLTAMDACANGNIVAQFVSDVRSNQICENKFTITRTYKATDGAGNTSTCAQIITVNDDEKPYFIQPPPTSPLTVSCYSDVPEAPVFTGRDNCSSPTDLEDITATFTQVRTDGSCENKYTLTRTWTLTDACGNTATYTQVINVDDKTGPTFNHPPAPFIEVDCASEIPEAPYLLAEDNCYNLATLPTVSFKEVISDQQCANKFTLTRTWTATDVCGNTSSVSQVIKVNDTKPPVFDNSPPITGITVSCTNDIPAIPTQTAYDNCGTPAITYSEEKTNVQCVNRYTLTRKWIATDACSNTASRTQVINVYDSESPKVTSVSATPVVLWPPNHKMRDVTINYTATDNCGVTSTLSVSSSDPVNGGSDGDQSPDWEVIDEHHVRLRAEKANNGQARYYTIKITITDGCNAPVDTSVTVVVAHNITGPQTGQPFKVGSTVPFNGVFWDKQGNKHTAKWLVDGSAVTNGTVTEPSGNQNGKVSGNYKFNSPGVYKLQMNVTDQTGITSYANTNNDLDAIIVIYDPNGGNTYGGGYFESPAGALRSNQNAMGKASYGFAMNYFKNSTNPKGETQFEFKVGDFEFNALNFDYLVINNAIAQFKGTGKIIGGQSGIGFTMTVSDGQVDGSGVDKIRMKIYNKNNGSIIYDNQFGASDADLPVQSVGSSSTVVINNSNTNATTANANQKAELEVGSVGNKNGFDVIALPNPSPNNFTMIVKTNSGKEKIIMHVVDMYGRVIETRNVNANSNIQFGEKYNPGTYVVRIIQGKNHKEIKLVKLPY
ncbi:MAG TPA: T9SS type A sorting domain-containing protein [Chitinophagaceae bacterium]|nr:T9SS type A sorting domain-containing protein [Chitinophagaceae bacterium]